MPPDDFEDRRQAMIARARATRAAQAPAPTDDNSSFVGRAVRNGLRLNPMTAPLMPGPALPQRVGAAAGEAERRARATNDDVDAPRGMGARGRGFAGEANPNGAPPIDGSYGEGVRAPGLRPQMVDPERSSAPAAPARGAGGRSRTGGRETEDLNAASLRLAQGAEPQTATERAIKARMDQLAASGTAMKKGGAVKAYAKGGFVAKGAPKPPKPSLGKPAVAKARPSKPTVGKPAFPPKPSAVPTGMRGAAGKQMFKKGGMIEGSKKDMAEDKKFAKKAGMSMKKWEKSPADKRHDAGKKPFKRGGAVKAKGY